MWVTLPIQPLHTQLQTTLERAGGPYLVTPKQPHHLHRGETWFWDTTWLTVTNYSGWTNEQCGVCWSNFQEQRCSFHHGRATLDQLCILLRAREDVEGFAPPVYMSFAYLLDFHCRFKSKSSIREGIWLHLTGVSALGVWRDWWRNVSKSCSSEFAVVVCLLCIPVGLLPPQRGDLGR